MTHRAVFLGPERSSSSQAAEDFDRLMVLVRMFAPDLIGAKSGPLGPEAFAEVERRFQRIREQLALEEALERAGPAPEPEPSVKFSGRKERA